jgi:hypothetical protein
MRTAIAAGVVGLALVLGGCAAKQDPDMMARVEAAANKAEAAANKAEMAAKSAADAASRAEAAAQKAEAIFAKGLRK